MNKLIAILAGALLVAPALSQADDSKNATGEPRKPGRGEHMERLKNADKDGSKTLSREEAKGMPHLEKNFDKLDANKDGQVDKKEMHAGKKSHRDDRKQRAEDKYNKADADHDGAISRDEAAKGMPRLTKNFDAMDGNKDGKLSKDEIKVYNQAKMQKLREKKDAKNKS